jgi:hypothetical protein
MAEPLGVAASIIAVLGLAWSSSKALYEFIDDLANAPKTIVEIKADLSALDKILESLEALLKDGKPSALATIFERVGIKSGLEACSAVCDVFRATLTKYTNHSTVVNATAAFRKILPKLGPTGRMGRYEPRTISLCF